MFHAVRLADEVVASSDDSRLRGVVWWWAGGPYIKYGLAGAPVGVLNVWDYETDSARIAFSAEALADYLSIVYLDPDEIAATVETIARG